MLLINVLFLSAALLLVVGEVTKGLLGGYGLSLLAILAATSMVFLIKKPSRPQSVVLFALLTNATLGIWLCNLTLRSMEGGNPVALLVLAVFIAIPFSNGIYVLRTLKKKAPTSSL